MDLISPFLSTASIHPRAKEGPKLQEPPLPCPHCSLQPHAALRSPSLGFTKAHQEVKGNPPPTREPREPQVVLLVGLFELN